MNTLVVIDITAGNRMMWRRGTPPLTVFMDRQLELRIPPDVFGDARQMPFRSNIFHTCFFDPPHDPRGPRTKSLYADPKGKYYGADITHAELVNLLIRAPEEIYRILRPQGRLCFKWSEVNITLWKVQTFFKKFKEIHRKPLSLNRRRRRNVPTKAKIRGGGYGSWWITYKLHE